MRHGRLVHRHVEDDVLTDDAGARIRRVVRSYGEETSVVLQRAPGGTKSIFVLRGKNAAERCEGGSLVLVRYVVAAAVVRPEYVNGGKIAVRFFWKRPAVTTAVYLC